VFDRNTSIWSLSSKGATGAATGLALPSSSMLPPPVTALLAPPSVVPPSWTSTLGEPVIERQ
jgi:hypothetical protein